MSPLRFCMVTTFYPPFHYGGDAVFVRGLAQALVAAGHAVEVVHCEDAYRLGGGEPPKMVDTDDGVVVHRLRSRLGALSPFFTQQTGTPGPKAPALRRILARDFDVIHFHNISLIGGPAVLGLGTAPVKLYTAHEFWLVCPMHVLWKNGREPCEQPECVSCCLRGRRPPQLWRYTGLVGRSLRHVDVLIALSAFSAERHRRSGIITCPIEVLPSFVSVDDRVAGAKARAAARPRFLYVGRLTRSKGVLDLLEQFRQLPDYDLCIAGTGELLETVQREAACHPNLHVLGAQSHAQVLSLYPDVTATIVPSVGPEIFPLVVMESMAYGTPVVVHEAGGSGEAVRATGGGVVYRASQELPSILRRIAEDDGWRAELGAKARQGYRERYTPAAHLGQYLDLIRRIRARKCVR